MKSVYVPFQGGKPAALSINGHRVILMSQEPGPLEEDLELFGADRLKRVDLGIGEEAEVKTLGQLAASAKGGVVMVPREVPVEEVIKTLEADLPWIQ